MSELAIIRIEDGNCHLVITFNYDANEPIQIEEYDPNGWNEPVYRFKSITDREFWDIWCDWNGRMCGGIYLTDNQSEEDIDNLLRPYGEIHKVNEIATLPDGEYIIEAGVD